MQHYSSSASEPVATFSYSVASPKADMPPKGWGLGDGLIPCEALEGFSEGVVHIERRLVLHLGVHHGCIELSGHFISLLAQICAHAADLIAVEVDGGNPLHITAIGHLVSFVVETIAGTAIGDKYLRVAQTSHAAEQLGNLLAIAVEADFTVEARLEVEADLGLVDCRSGFHAE